MTENTGDRGLLFPRTLVSISIILSIYIYTRNGFSICNPQKTSLTLTIPTLLCTPCSGVRLRAVPIRDTRSWS
jgi:hypothetical protein